jgi:hypothetical protein
MIWTLFSRFNSSIWNVFWVLAPMGTFIFLWYFVEYKGHWYHFDPKHSKNPADASDYEPHSQRYQDIAKLAITLSGAAIDSSLAF